MTRPRIDSMVRAAARLTGTPMPAIRGESMVRALARIRMAVALVAYRQGHSLSQIAVALGRTDHSTAHYLKTRALDFPEVVALAHRIERIVTGVEPMPPAPEPVARTPVPSTVRITSSGYINRRGEIVVGPLPGAEVNR